MASSPVAAARPDAASKRAQPKVVIVVGPAGDATESYRALADEAAAAARRYTSSVITLYSPSATWPHVKAALNGASVVVYLGHGNGFPSRYRSERWQYSQNGFGLNVTGATDDTAHQYFGEYYLAREVSLAPHAVVILSHLCYASGNSEPGLPEGSLQVAVQRVDNYAAGFIAAGASAVIAEGHLGPAYYVSQVLGSRRGVAGIWDSAPTFHDNVVAVDSQRSPGYRDYLDPDAVGAGFYRSLVVSSHLNTHDVLRGAARDVSTPGTSTEPSHPIVLRPPAQFGGLILRDAPSAGGTIRVSLPITTGRSRLPADATLGVRWDPLFVDEPTLGPAVPTTPRGGGVVPAVGGQSIDVTQKLALQSWIVPERLGDVVQTDVAKLGSQRVTARILVPQLRGLYRLTVTLADRDGAELGAGQALQPGPYLVQVVGKLGVSYGTAPTLEALSQERAVLPVRLSNSGADPWWTPGQVDGSGPLKLIARWIPLALAGSEMPAPAVTSVPALRPGASVDVRVELTAPTTPGEYLILLDVLLPDGSSMAGSDAPPRIVRATVAQAPSAHTGVDLPGLDEHCVGSRPGVPDPQTTCP